MLDRAVAALQLSPANESPVRPSLALANTLTTFATTQRYAGTPSAPLDS